MISVRAACNPAPGWVKEYFYKPCPTGNKFLLKKLDDGSYSKRIFVPATIEDNPDPVFRAQYKKKLMGLSEPIKQAQLYGNWDFDPAAFFAEHWRPDLHVIPPFKVPGDWHVFRALDWGYKTPGCVGWFAVDYDGNLICVREFTFRFKDGDQVAMDIRAIEQEYGWWDDVRNRSKLIGPADTNLWGETSSADSHADQMMKRGVSWVKADKKSRRLNGERVMKRLDSHNGGTQRPGLMFMRGSTTKCVETLPTIPGDWDNPDEDKRSAPKKCDHDHWYDMVSYGCAYRTPDGEKHRKAVEARRKRNNDDERPVRRKRGNWGRMYGANY